ncbi:MAG: radical SAM protein [Deltaproteobacteria bacterium]|nr:radical SAM protein [Deltaproteobacteria bacterium]
MPGWLRKQWDRLTSPSLDWVQVGVTTGCNAACIYCPRTLLKNRWKDRHMPMALLENLIPFVGRTDLVFLQGWGEPLLHPQLFDMIRLCKKRGKRVGFTTNGLLLTEETVRILVDLDLDVLGVSLAGTTAKTHNRIRKGCDFDRVISQLHRLQQVKQKKNSPTPVLHLAYLMLRSNFHELNGIVPLAERLGARQIVASHLTLLMDPCLAGEVIFHDTARLQAYREALEAITRRAETKGIVFEHHDPALSEASSVCPENVGHACVISVDGDVIPCVFSDPVLSPDRPHGDVLSGASLFEGQSLPPTSMSFGNIRKASLTRIWRSQMYATFRALFDPNRTIEVNALPRPCRDCYMRRVVRKGGGSQDFEIPLDPPFSKGEA